MLTQKRLKELLNYNANTGCFTWIKNRNNKVKIGDIAGNINKEGYRKIHIDGVSYLEHRLAFLYVSGAFPLNQVDHINGIKTDNKFSNLRHVSSSENCMNQRKHRADNKTKLLGVSWHSVNKKYIAQIQIKGKKINLGYYENKEDAYQAYIKAKRMYHPTGTI